MLEGGPFGLHEMIISAQVSLSFVEALLESKMAVGFWFFFPLGIKLRALRVAVGLQQ